MIDKPKASLVLGLELDAFYLKGALVSYQNGRSTLIKTYNIKVEYNPDFSSVKPLYIDGQEKELYHDSNSSLVITALPTHEALVRNLEIQLTKEKDIDEVLEFQTENILPFPLDTCIIDRVFLEKRKESTLLSIVAAKKDHIKLHLELFHELHIEPEVISCTPSALTAFSDSFCLTKKAHFVIDLGIVETTCLVVEEEKLLAAQSCKLGLQDLQKAYEQDLNSQNSSLHDTLETMDFSTVNSETFLELYKKIQQWHLEITKITYALSKQIRDKEIEEVLFTGEGASWKSLAIFLSQNLNKKVIEPTLKENFLLSISETEKFACCIGLALTALPKARHQINFRQKELLFPNPWKRLKFPIATFLTLCVFFSFVLSLFSQAYVSNKENKLKSEYLNLLMLMQKPISNFEKDKEESPSIEEFPNLISLSQEDIQSHLHLLEKEVKDAPETFPLLPNIPHVSDVLAWLSSHPHIRDISDETPKIKLESFSYKMVKRPEHNKKKERYQAKVELEFSSSTPTYAREFHDILIAPNDIIDPRSEVNWNIERGKYRASFFLKDKTIYPSGKS
jgi:type IV pilus assembly protein PilM